MYCYVILEYTSSKLFVQIWNYYVCMYTHIHSPNENKTFVVLNIKNILNDVATRI